MNCFGNVYIDRRLPKLPQWEALNEAQLRHNDISKDKRNHPKYDGTS